MENNLENNRGAATNWLMVVMALIIGLGLGFLAGSGVEDSDKQDDDQMEAMTEQEPVATEISFVNHIQAAMPEQDVFILNPDNAEQVLRIEGEQATDAEILAQTAYATAEAAGHDPFKVGDNPLGPFAKGEALGFTMAEWLAGAGNGTYTVNEGAAELDLEFTDLISGGTYTVWCSMIKLPPEPVVLDQPCGALDGSENIFVAGADGSGSTVLELAPLDQSTESVVSVIALAYHSDGETHGFEPGDFGKNSHVQLFYIMPAQ